MSLVQEARGAEPPLRREHAHTWDLIGQEDIYRIGGGRDQLFALAMREICSWHFERNSLYRSLCRREGFEPADPAGPERVPILAAEVFKHFDLSTLRGPECLHLSSSGTSGRGTTIALDHETLGRMWAMGLATARAEGIVTDDPVHHVLLAPSPAASTRHGNAHFFASLATFAPARETLYALTEGPQGELRLDTAAVVSALERFSAAGEPVRLIGLPALMARLARACPPGHVSLAPQSLVLTGGGWKAEAAAALPKEAFRELIERAWGVPDHRIRDLYGMTEHAVHYLECRRHRFHPPLFARVRILDPLTREPLPAGSEGVLHLLNPGFTTMPLHSLLTADVGRFVDRCSCGRGTPAFEVRGRGGTTRYRGCAATTLARVDP